MLILCVVVLGVCSNVVISMEGPRGKVTREMCSLPAAQVPEEHWPYCCEGYGNHCEDFAASCYLDCQPVVSSGSDVTLVEERPGFCCALYNFCCVREFARISGNTEQVQVEEQFPTFHRFHVPGKQAPRWTPAPRENIVRQHVNNDISDTPSTVNRVGRNRKPSRNNGNREKQDRIVTKSSESIESIENDFAFGLSRSKQQINRFNSKPIVVTPQISSKPNVVKSQRNPVRFPLRPQTDKTKNTETPNTSEIQTSNIQTDDSLRKIAPTKKPEIKAKSKENREDIKNANENVQQLNREAENRKITLNRAGANRRDKLSNTKGNLKATNDNDEELTPRNQPQSANLPTTNESQSTESQSTEQPIARRQNNGRKVKMGRRVLVRTAPKKISKTEQEIPKTTDAVKIRSGVNPTSSRRTLISNRHTPKTNRANEQKDSKSTDSVQIRQEAKSTAGRRTVLSNRRNSKKIISNEQENSKSLDSVQSRQELNPTASRRTVLKNRQAIKKINNNGQELSKSIDSVQIRQEVKPTASRRTNISNRQTGSRRSRPTVSRTNESASKETNQDESNTSNRSGDNNRGRRVKQTVRRVSPDSSQKEHAKLATHTTTEQKEVLPKQRISIANKPVTEQIAPNVSKTEKTGGILNAPKNDQPEQTSDVKTVSLNTDRTPSYLPLKRTSDVKIGSSDTDKIPSYLPVKKASDTKEIPLNTDKTPSHLPLSNEGNKTPKLDLDSSASQISEDQRFNQNNLKISEQESTKDETETKSPEELYENTTVTGANADNKSPLEIRKANKVNENNKEIETSPSNTNNKQQTRTRSRTTIPIAVTNSRTKVTPSTGENSAITSSRTRSRSSSRTRNQDQTLQEETISTATTNRGTTRSQRLESFGRKDASKSTVQNSPVNTENTPRRTTRRRGRQPT